MILNLKEFKDLIVRYESLTMEDILKVVAKIDRPVFQPDAIAKELTGFGSERTCSLCKPLLIAETNEFPSCENCVYSLTGAYNRKLYFCNNGDNDETFKDISDAFNEEDLLMAYKSRAQHMKNILEDYKDEILNQ